MPAVDTRGAGRLEESERHPLSSPEVRETQLATPLHHLILSLQGGAGEQEPGREGEDGGFPDQTGRG